MSDLQPNQEYLEYQVLQYPERPQFRHLTLQVIHQSVLQQQYWYLINLVQPSNWHMRDFHLLRVSDTNKLFLKSKIIYR